MRGIGLALLILGIGASVFVLLRLPLQFFFPLWIDNWGTTVGWVIRISMIVIGAALVALGSRATPRGKPLP